MLSQFMIKRVTVTTYCTVSPSLPAMGNYLFHKPPEEFEKTNLTKTLNELKDAIGEGDTDKMKKIIDKFHQNLVRNKQLLTEQYTSGSQCVTQTDLIDAACRKNQAKTLYFLLKETDILDHLPGTSFDDPMVKEQRTEALKHALRLDAFPMVEMLYDYWCGDLHWIGHDINKLTSLGELLADARVDVVNQTLLLNIRLLIKFNDFQQKLYSSLCQKINSEAKNIVKVLSIYDEYSDLKKIRVPHEDMEIEQTLKAQFEDDSNEYMEIQVYIKYEVYFRKLEFNVALLVLENLFILRQHLRQRFNKPKERNPVTNQPAVQPSIYKDVVTLYEEIECALYHFIYSTNDDWRWYLPENRKITTEEHHKGIHKGRVINNLKITYDGDKLNSGPVLFLERKSFSKSLNELKLILTKHVINEDPAKQGQSSRQKEENVLGDNHLSANMYMSEYYSLRKIVYYIEALEDTEDILKCSVSLRKTLVLMIERVLQVTGEMLKSTKESNHLLLSTRSLLQIATSVEAIKYLGDIRLFLSHTDDAQVNTRINIANEQEKIFAKVKEDLKDIKKIINVVLDIYKPILEKSLLERGLGLFDERLKILPDETSRHICKIDDLYKKHGKELLFERGLIFQELRAYTDLPTQLLKEFIWICTNRVDISSKIQLAQTTFREQLLRILPICIQNISQTRELIIENRRNINQINLQFRDYNINELPDDPKTEDLDDRKRKVIKKVTVNVDSLIVTLNKIKDFTNHWQAMSGMLCCLYNWELFAPDAPKLQIIENDLATVTNLLAKLKEICRDAYSCKNLAAKHTFGGIEELYRSIKPALSVIKKKKTESSDLCEKRKQLILCLIGRVNLLKDTLQYPQHIPLVGIAPSDQHLRRYKHDKKFRFVLEMILADIANVLVLCKQKELMNKSAKLLREINLGNVLDHGNPFLEVIGDVFDSYDLSTGLLSKAIMFAKDGESIEALFELIQDGVDYETIEKNRLEKMNDVQKTVYEQLQKSPNWEDYVNLHPKSPQWGQWSTKNSE